MNNKVDQEKAVEFGIVRAVSIFFLPMTGIPTILGIAAFRLYTSARIAYLLAKDINISHYIEKLIGKCILETLAVAGVFISFVFFIKPILVKICNVKESIPARDKFDILLGMSGIVAIYAINAFDLEIAATSDLGLLLSAASGVISVLAFTAGEVLVAAKVMRNLHNSSHLEYDLGRLWYFRLAQDIAYGSITAILASTLSPMIMEQISSALKAPMLGFTYGLGVLCTGSIISCLLVVPKKVLTNFLKTIFSNTELCV